MPVIQLTNCAGASGWLDPGDKDRDDNDELGATVKVPLVSERLWADRVGVQAGPDTLIYRALQGVRPFTAQAEAA